LQLLYSYATATPLLSYSCPVIAVIILPAVCHEWLHILGALEARYIWAVPYIQYNDIPIVRYVSIPEAGSDSILHYGCISMEDFRTSMRITSSSDSS